MRSALAGSWSGDKALSPARAREVVESPCLQVFRRGGCTAFGGTVVDSVVSG